MLPHNSFICDHASLRGKKEIKLSDIEPPTVTFVSVHLNSSFYTNILFAPLVSTSHNINRRQNI